MSDFREMNYVLAIAKYQNITKAANALYISQPTLTKFLQNLEAELGQDLFKRVGNKYVPTYAGERYLEKARQIVGLKKELDQEMGDIVRNNEGVIRVSFPVMRGSYMLPCTLPIFHSLYPNVKIEITEKSSGELEDLLTNGDTDLAFFNLPVRKPLIDYDVISHEEVLLVAAKDNAISAYTEPHPDCRYPWIDIHKLQGQSFILQIPGQRTRAIVDNLFKREKFNPENIVLETCNIRASVELAAKNYGICFVTETHLRHIGMDGALNYFSIGTPKTTVDFVVAYRKGSYLSYHEREYIKIVKDFT